jgi:hypothetical protein
MKNIFLSVLLLNSINIFATTCINDSYFTTDSIGGLIHYEFSLLGNSSVKSSELTNIVNTVVADLTNLKIDFSCVLYKNSYYLTLNRNSNDSENIKIDSQVMTYFTDSDNSPVKTDMCISVMKTTPEWFDVLQSN